MPDPSLKILVVGARYTGKGAIGRAWGRTDADLPTLQPVILYERKMNFKDIPTRVVSWVLSFDPEFEVLRRHFYNAAQGIILTFSLSASHQDTLDRVEEYLGEIKREIGICPPQILVGVALKPGDAPSPSFRDQIRRWIAAHDSLPYFEADFTKPTEFAQTIDNALAILLSRL
jgi:hypothetical protein